MIRGWVRTPTRPSCTCKTVWCPPTPPQPRPHPCEKFRKIFRPAWRWEVLLRALRLRRGENVWCPDQSQQLKWTVAGNANSLAICEYRIVAPNGENARTLNTRSASMLLDLTFHHCTMAGVVFFKNWAGTCAPPNRCRIRTEVSVETVKMGCGVWCDRLQCTLHVRASNSGWSHLRPHRSRRPAEGRIQRR